ncbi:MAG: hypothetical protein ACI9VR_000010 [Cognaticolwellia sp.]
MEVSPIGILQLGSFALIFVGQRLLTDTTGMVITLVGVVGLLAAVAMRVSARTKAEHKSTAAAHSKALILQILGLVAVAVYGLSTDACIDALGLEDEMANRWEVVFYALWPVLTLASTVPLLLVDAAIQDSPLAVQPLRVRHAIDNGVVVALGISLLFPINYLASQTNERFDYAYFKTTEVGGSSRAIVENLNEPVTARIFLPTSSDVAAELMPYFEDLASANPGMFKVELVDHAAVPALAESLKIRDNGYIALTIRDGEDNAQTKSWKVGDDLDKAKRNLKKLDQEFQKRMLDLAKDDRVAYFTVGHEELNWKGGDFPEDKLTQLKQGMQKLNFKVKELGLSQGLGDSIPDDASVVVVMAPKMAFLPAEVQAIQDYLARGGSVILAVEPGTQEENAALLSLVGAELGEGILTSEVNYLAKDKNLADRYNVVTNRYSSHASTVTLGKYSRQLQLITPRAGWLKETTPVIVGTKTTVTVRSLQDNFADLNGNLELDKKTEKKEVRPIAMVATGPAPMAPNPDDLPQLDEASEADADPPEFRVVIVADSTLFSDLALASQGNQVFVSDALNWLLGDEALAGTTESEEDVKIEHTKEDQTLWFYGTSLGVPLIVLLLGLLRVRRRKRSTPDLRTGDSA